MANRRMFSNRIANSGKFLQMPAETQLLYFHFVLRADDDGIVESYPIVKLLGLAPDNLKVLLAKGFIQQLNEDQVVVIMDWQEHNAIRADRKIDSIYIHLLKEKFPEISLIEPKPRSDVKDNSSRIVHGQSTVGLSKVRLGKVRLGKETHTESFNALSTLTSEVLNAIAKEYGVPYGEIEKLQKELELYCQSKGKRYSNYKAALQTWVRRRIDENKLHPDRQKTSLIEQVKERQHAITY